MAKQYIKIRGANEHNLKNISIDIPRNELVVLTGLSGSGKSSLAFDTIYAEGQRRYMESLSSYARQFLGQMEKPDVESIEGLSPAISIDQKSTNRNPRSTVGTVTEISGGQRTKVLLGKLLLEKPDILLLDEPTNYLDVQHIDWLKRYLQEYENAFILISHDIPFLNSVINLIYHMENQRLDRYVGDYDKFQEGWLKVYSYVPGRVIARKIACMLHRTKHTELVDLIDRKLAQAAAVYQDRQFVTEKKEQHSFSTDGKEGGLQEEETAEQTKIRNIQERAEARKRELECSGKKVEMLKEEPFLYAKDSFVTK